MSQTLDDLLPTRQYSVVRGLAGADILVEAYRPGNTDNPEQLHEMDSGARKLVLWEASWNQAIFWSVIPSRGIR